MSSPAITILLPIHNAAPYLREAADSLLAQSFQDFELLAIDDGSTDGSLEILESYDDPRIMIIRHSQQMGLPATLNEGIQLASAPLIARADADDEYDLQRLLIQYEVMQEHPEIGICGTAIVFTDTKEFWEPPVLEADIHAAMLQGSPFAHPSVMFRKQALIDNGLFYDESFRNSEDYDLWIRCRNKVGMINTQEPLVFYRRHPDQASTGRLQQQIEYNRMLRLRLLHELVPDAGQEFEALHLRMLDYQMQPEDLKRGKAARWLWKLLRANRRENIYSPTALKERLQYIYYEGIRQLFQAYPELRNNRLLVLKSLLAGGSIKKALSVLFRK